MYSLFGGTGLRCYLLLFIMRLATTLLLVLVAAICGANCVSAHRTPSLRLHEDSPSAVPVRRLPPPRPHAPQAPVNGDAAEPLNVEGFGAGPVTFITAHPDDIEGCAGGLVAQLRAQGTRVTYFILTNGNQGCSNPTLCNATLTNDDIAVMRQHEAIAAAAVLNVSASDVFLFDYDDMLLQTYPYISVQQRLAARIREIQPYAIFTWHPDPNWYLLPSANWDDIGYHPDHQQSGKLAVDARLAAGLGYMWPELGAPWYATQLYFFDFARPTHYINIEGQLDLKIASYCAHQSQIPACSMVKPIVMWVAEAVANTSTVQPSGVQFAEGFLAYF